MKLREHLHQLGLPGEAVGLGGNYLSLVPQTAGRAALHIGETSAPVVVIESRQLPGEGGLGVSAEQPPVVEAFSSS